MSQQHFPVHGTRKVNRRRAAAWSAIAGAIGVALAIMLGGNSAPAPQSAYMRAIGSMGAHCTQDAPQLEAMVGAVHHQEVSAGITDEPVGQLAAHLAAVVAAYPRRVSCVQPFADYLTMREGS